jgi:hypothetical protein
MSAADNLNPQQFYHGTDHEFKPGDSVEPGASGRAYATTKAASAKMYGSHVYEVAFTGEHETDPEYGGSDMARMTSAPMTVVKDATGYARQRVRALDFIH